MNGFGEKKGENQDGGKEHMVIAGKQKNRKMYIKYEER
jgi:hypothetical protein